MIIANPIYDAVFKYLLEDKEIARQFIGTIIDENIVEIDFQPQEFTSHTFVEFDMIGILRLDFLATIKTETGDLKKVLIELQKGKESSDLFRFRRYLGEQLAKKDEILNEDGEYYSTVLPIITIYFLGFTLKDVPTAALKVNRGYFDLMAKKPLTGIKNEFIEILTHDCYVVQIPRLPDHLKTKLEYVLSVFDQTYAFDYNRLLDYPFEIRDPFIKRMLDRLSNAAKSARMRKEIDLQESLQDKVKRDLAEYRAEIAEHKQVIAEHKQVIADKDSALAEKDSALAEKDSALAEKDSALAELQRQLIEMKAKLENPNG